jgi:hypothetical protein
MRLLDVQVHIFTEIDRTPTIIRLTAKFEDMVENWPVELTLNDLVHIHSEDIHTVFKEVERIRSEHPFFKLNLCESPIELKFFCLLNAQDSEFETPSGGRPISRRFGNS